MSHPDPGRGSIEALRERILLRLGVLGMFVSWSEIQPYLGLFDRPLSPIKEKEMRVIFHKAPPSSARIMHQLGTLGERDPLAAAVVVFALERRIERAREQLLASRRTPPKPLAQFLMEVWSEPLRAILRQKEEVLEMTEEDEVTDPDMPART